MKLTSDLAISLLMFVILINKFVWLVYVSFLFMIVTYLVR